MSSTLCPNCRHQINFKDAKPGRYQPKCPACKESFALTISADPAVLPVAKALATPAKAADPSTTAPPRAAMAAPSSNVSDPGVTAPPRSASAAPLAKTAGSGVTAPPRGVAPPPDSDDIYDIAPRGEHGSEFAPKAPVAPPDEPAPEEFAQTRPPERAAERTSATARPVAAKSAAPRPSARSAQDGAEVIPAQGRIGGYEISQKLGQGGMGAVYLARQISLDRDVALKVLAPTLASDPEFVSRFTREAFAAAQLSHHNVVQIHDIGVQTTKGTDTNYFSMEFVDGQTLAGVVKETGKLDPEAAVGYTLQAARGLKFAHDHGLIHRDVKPENLLLNDQGVVKVADLGLVKRSGVTDKLGSRGKGAVALAGSEAASATQVSVAMGTPAYMPPEQAVDAANVDARADIYSLGCTLYDLLTGRPPFTGSTAAEVMTKHAKEAVIPPDRLVQHVPSTLSAIVTKMMAKRPEDRYADMGEVIAALEGWLGMESGKPFSPKAEHVNVLELAAAEFNASKWNRLRKRLILAFFGLSLIAIIVLALPLAGMPLVSAGMVGFVIATLISYQVTYGLARRTFLLSKFRQLAFGSSIVDWLINLIVLTLLVGMLMAFHLLWIWIGFAVLAVGVAVGFFFSVDLLLARDRESALKQAEALIKEMRLRGLDENSVRQFICKYSGDNWEEFYEALFGYEAKLTARRAWGQGDRGRNRPKFGAWREPVIAWIERKMRLRREAREAKMLARIEAKAMQARGIDKKDSEKQARETAHRAIERAAEMRETAMLRAAETAIPMKVARGAGVKPIAVSHIDRPGKVRYGSREREGYLKSRFGAPLDILFGQGIRLIIGITILAGFGMWWSANSGKAGLEESKKLLGSREDPAITAAKKDVISGATTTRDLKPDAAATERKPLRITLVPPEITDAVGSWNGGLAGALLALSAIFRGRILGLCVLISAAVGLAGQKFGIGFLAAHEWAVSVAAATLWVFGIFFFRSKD